MACLTIGTLATNSLSACSPLAFVVPHPVIKHVFPSRAPEDGKQARFVWLENGKYKLTIL